ncbi:MAG: hypothetical protein MJ003_04690 [Paludibacteraceae bacterium]|nr:hypothetical protein [Paludibacteraceae bacterium]
MNTQKFKDNGYNKFPLSTDTLEFMQEQIKLLYGLSSLVGQNIIIQDSTATTDGLVIFNGEIMPLKGSRLQSISRKEVSEDISFNDTTIEGARIKRYAVYASVAGIPRAAFTEIKSIKDIMDDLAEAKRHHSPKGTVIDWYGEASFDNIPYGWVPCCGFFTNNNYSICNTEKQKWTSRYSNATAQIGHNGSLYYVRITKIGNMDIPNLAGRFIVGAGIDTNALYSPNDTGGEAFHLLTAAESGLPAHTHKYDKYDPSEGNWFDNGGDSTKHWDTLESSKPIINGVEYPSGKNAEVAHENRPPFYALYKLIKVI